MSLYLWINLGCLIIPLIFSFHSKLRFDKRWPSILPAILITLVIYIIWDQRFTDMGVWGFNEIHLLGFSILGLPIEEWLFFVCIPFACLFTHHCLGVLASQWQLSQKLTRSIVLVLLLIWGISLLLFYDRWYTLVNFLWAIALTIAALKLAPHILQRFMITYVIILLPFIIVNGMLTGALIPEPVVWYNDAENVGLRLFMPVEDYTYAFTMLLTSLLIENQLFNSNSSIA